MRGPKKKKYTPQSKEPKTRVNELITEEKVILIDHEGVNRGEVLTSEAIKLAKEQDLDLVEVAANASPPVCKLRDYGRMVFEKQKKAKQASKRQKTIQVKEIKIRPKIDVHDLEIKAKMARKFLLGGDRLKISMFFRGREKARREAGVPVFEKLLSFIGHDIVVIENPDTYQKDYKMLVTPNPTKLDEERRRLKKLQKAKEAEETQTEDKKPKK